MKIKLWALAVAAAFVALSFALIPMRMAEEQPGAPSGALTKVVEKSGAVERTDYVDDQGKLTYARDKHYATMTRTRDDDTNTVLEEYFDENGDRAVQTSGQYALLRTYDDRNKNIEILYLDAELAPMNLTGGYALLKRTYDDAGRQTSEFYFDVDGAAALNASYGDHGFIREYPGDGPDYRMTYLGLDGEPAAVKFGYTAVDRRLNGDKKVVEEHYLDADGAPCAAVQGEYGVKRDYDDDGHEIEILYIDAEGRPMMTRRGYAAVRKSYDEAGALAYQMYYDASGQPAAQTRGEYGIDLRDGLRTPLTLNGRVKPDLNYFLRAYPLTVLVFGLLAVALSALLDRRWNRLLLAGYLVFIIYMTLLYRGEVQNRLNTELFWSYKQFFTWQKARVEILENIWLFIPLGAILYRLCDSPWVLLLPVMLSVSVELAQYVFSIGLCEFDDMISNALGGCIGWMMGHVAETVRNLGSRE